MQLLKQPFPNPFGFGRGGGAVAEAVRYNLNNQSFMELDNSLIPSGQNSYVISMWFRWDSGVATGTQYLLTNRGTAIGTGATRVSLYKSGSNNMRLTLGQSGTDGAEMRIPNSAFNDGSWHHIVWSYNGAGPQFFKAYLDGADVTPALTRSDWGGVSTVTYWRAMGNEDLATNYAPTRCAHGLELRQFTVWGTNTFVDLDDADVRAKFFNPATPTTPVPFGSDGSKPFGEVAQVYLNADATNQNHDVHAGSSAINTVLRGVDFAVDSEKIAFFKIGTVDEADIADWTLIGSPGVAERTDYPRIFDQCLEINNSASSTLEGIYRTWGSAQYADWTADTPLHFYFWQSAFGTGSRKVVIRIYEDSAATANYAQFEFSFSYIQQGCFDLMVLPVWLDESPLPSTGTGHLPTNCSVTEAGTGWTRTNGIERIDVMWEDLNSYSDAAAVDANKRRMAFCGIGRGYPHTPVFILNQDDGVDRYLSVNYDNGDGSMNTYDYTDTKGVKDGISQIGTNIDQGSNWTLAEWNQFIADGRIEIQCHGNEAWTKQHHFFPITGSGFDTSSTVSSSGTGSGGNVQGVLLDNETGSQIGLFLANGYLGDFLDGELVTDGSGGFGTIEGDIAPVTIQNLVDLIYNQVYAINNKGDDPAGIYTSYAAVYPQGGYRDSGVVDVNEKVRDALKQLSFTVCRSTTGFHSGVTDLPDGASPVNGYGADGLSFGACSLEDTVHFATALSSAEITDAYMEVTARQGGCFWMYYHDILTAGNPRGPQDMPVDLLHEVIAKIAEMKDAGYAKSLHVRDYVPQLTANPKIALVATEFQEDFADDP